ncbi:MAG: YceI family protein [Pseudobacteriovorax sp.]|nr:YceI family protein [Pseudobacteriovorax sp.]
MKVLLISLGLSSVVMANTVADADLNLWQITYRAETSFADGYTIEGQSNSFEGSFQYDGTDLFSIEGVVDPKSLSSGISSRDKSIVKIIFTDEEGNVPTLAFESEEVRGCEDVEEFRVCDVAGRFKVRNEWQPMDLKINLSEYGNQTWVNVSGEVSLAQYDFYERADAQIKVVDKVTFVVDLLSDEAME